jgi:hypothetical protein
MELKKLRNFYSVNIFTREVAGAEETHEGPCEAQTRPGGAGPSLVVPPRPVPSSSVALRQSFYVQLCPGQKPLPYFY